MSYMSVSALQKVHTAMRPTGHCFPAEFAWLVNHSADQDKLYLIAPETYPTEYPDERCFEIPPGHVADFR